MKRFLIIWNFLLFTLVSDAQDDYFLFIQSENNQPYYVQTGGKTLSSSAIGHLIISGLKDSIHTLHIGFPKNQFPEQLFQVRISKKDAGYQLKNLGAEGWELFNIQTLQLTKPQQGEAKKQTIAYGDIKKTDVFSTLMAGLVNDSAVLYTSIAKAEPVKESSKASIPDTPVTNNVIAKQEEQDKKDSALAQNALIKQDAEVKPDTLKTEMAQKDTLQAGTEILKQGDIPKKDTASAGIDIVKPEKLTREDSSAVKSDAGKKEEPLKKDTAVKGNELAKQLPAVSDQKAIVDTLSKDPSNTELKVANITSPELKSLIIWFSETKTANGTELVYFDMSSPDRIDTIRILIPQEEARPVNEIKKDEKSDSIGVKKEGQKSGAGNFIGRIFGKKTGTEPKGAAGNKNKSESNQSSIKVTTVEDKKPADSAVVKDKNSNDAGRGKVEISANQKEREQKNNSGNFLGKIFGKKNSAEASVADTIKKIAPAQNSSTAKVATIENPKSGDSTVAVARKTRSDESTAEVEKLKKDQENAEKTSTERFFGKIFGKKKNELRKDSAMKVEAKGNQSYIKVTTIETTKNMDTARSRDAEKKVVMVNSDCNDFATYDDIEKLKVKMLSKKDIDGQIVEAKRFFKTKCLSTKQVKALSTLYKTDADKYKLFDASYPFVSDSNNFMDLVVLLNEVYYINRFIAMVRM